MPNYRNAPKEINPHYNREFELLMSGQKKVAVFSTGFFADSDWPDERYDKAVTEGKLLKLDFTETYRYRKIHYVYFYHPEAIADVERLKLLHQLNFTPEDNESIDIETETGQLLGYREEEIQAWLEFFNVGEKQNKLLYPHRYKELEMMLDG